MAATICALAGVALAVAACGNTEPDGTRPTTQVPSPATATPPASTQQWVMPNLVGSNLQAAQDRIQAVTGNPLFLTLSHDATGKSRQQIVDSNWKVCSQNIAPGALFDTHTTIDFAAVMSSEKCP